MAQEEHAIVGKNLYRSSMCISMMFGWASVGSTDGFLASIIMLVFLINQTSSEFSLENLVFKQVKCEGVHFS